MTPKQFIDRAKEMPILGQVTFDGSVITWSYDANDKELDHFHNLADLEKYILRIGEHDENILKEIIPKDWRISHSWIDSSYLDWVIIPSLP